MPGIAGCGLGVSPVQFTSADDGSPLIGTPITKGRLKAGLAHLRVVGGELFVVIEQHGAEQALERGVVREDREATLARRLIFLFDRSTELAQANLDE